MQFNEVTLLSYEETVEDKKIEVIDKVGTQCAVSDFAILLGADISEVNHVSNDKSLKGRTCGWCLSSFDGTGDMLVYDNHGDLQWILPGVRYGCIRPVIPFDNIDDFVIYSRDKSILETPYGEYPQYVVSTDLQKILDKELANGNLKETEKTYETDSININLENERFAPIEHVEYEYDGKRYVRVKSRDDISEHFLSNYTIALPNRYYWIEVAPITWYVDKKAKLLVSKIALAAGIRYGKYTGDFKNTEMYMFLNKYFAKDIVNDNDLTVINNSNSENKKLVKKSNPYNLNFNNISEEEIIKGMVESGVAVFLHGPSSEGKSARVKQIDPTCEIIYLRNASPESLNGKSVYNQETGEMLDVKPTWLKKVEAKCESEPDKLHIVFFDEITNALPSIQGIAFNIVLDREVNGIWKLPDNARIVASGNEMEDSLAANQLAEPLFNRFAHVYIKTTTESWLKWASEHNIHPAIYTYIAYKKGKTLRSKFNGEKPNADPRKWEMASKVLYATGNPQMLRSLVGEDITKEFISFCKNKVITLEDVIEGNYEESEIKELNTAERYATAMTLSQVDEDNLEKVRTFVAKLGGECRAIFDSLWTRGEDERLEKIAELEQSNYTKEETEEIVDMVPDDVELTLLGLDEVQGNTKLNVLEKYGSCSIMCNDLTTVTGAASDYYYTKTADAEGDIYIVDECGNLGIAEAGDYNGLIRPVLVSPTIFSEVYHNRYAIDDTHYVQYGEYPQFAASPRLQIELNDAETTGKLIPTGRKYTFYQQHGTRLITYPEYEYKKKRFIKANVYIYGDVGAMLSDGEIYETGDDVWLSVDTITWLVDEENKRLISEYGLLSGVKFHRLIKSSFEKSSVYRFLNDHMLKDMLQFYEEEKVKRKRKK